MGVDIVLLKATIDSVGLDSLDILVVGDLQTIWRNAISTANSVSFLAYNTSVMWWVIVSVLMGGSCASEPVICRVSWLQIDASINVT